MSLGSLGSISHSQAQGEEAALGSQISASADVHRNKISHFCGEQPRTAQTILEMQPCVLHTV